jgi:hypothetical protein
MTGPDLVGPGQAVPDLAAPGQVAPDLADSDLADSDLADSGGGEIGRGDDANPVEPDPLQARFGGGLVLRWRSWSRLGDVLAVAWIALFVIFYLAPALKDGAAFGPADLGRGLSLLTHILPIPINHNAINGDTITQGVPWNTLDWRIVHHGELPLWNSLSGTGLPQMFNFESAPLSLPTIIGYLAPLSASFLVTVAAKLFIAGTGVYLCCRVLGTGPLAGAFAGTTFMLSGAFAGWLGWSVDGPIAWGGWILAAAMLAYRSRGQVRHVLLLAVTVAFSLYAGFPESYVLLAIGLGVVLLVTGAVTLAARRRVGAIGVARIGIGIVAGGALAAPLLLPGVSLISGSARNGKNAATGIPLHLATLLFAQGFFGLPTKGSYWFGEVNYYETAAYVGVIAIVLAAVAVLVAWRRPAVVGLFVSAVVGFLVIYQLGSGAPVQKLLSKLGLSAVALQRMQSVFELVVAILAGIGLEIVIRRWRMVSVRLALLASSLAVAVVLAALWEKVGTARLIPTPNPPTNPPTIATLESLRRSSLIWPTASIVLVLVLAGAAWALRKRGDHKAPGLARAGALTLLAAQSSFLLFAGVGLNSYSHDAFPVTPAAATVQQVVGTKLLGLDGENTDCNPTTPHNGPFCGVRFWTGAGFYPEMNIGYGVDELAMHDPTIPQAFFDAWPVPNAEQVTPINLNLFAPAIDTVALARRYGVSYVLYLPRKGDKPPVGMRLVATAAGEQLYAVPGASQFSFVANAGANGAAGTASGSAPAATVTSVTHPGDARYVVNVRVTRAAKLAVRITDVTGWHATADGKSVPVERYDGGLLSVEVPAGTHTVVLHYWPKRFTEGILLALVALLGFVVWAVLLAVGRRRGRAGRSPRAAAAGTLD